MKLLARTMNRLEWTNPVAALMLAALLVSACGNPRRDAGPGEAARSNHSEDTSSRRTDVPTHNCMKQYAGAIDNHIHIQASICRENGGVTGTLHYEKAPAGAVLALHGTYASDGTARVEEVDSRSGRVTGAFTGRFDSSGGFSGTWQSPDGAKTMQFTIALGSQAAAAPAEESFAGEWESPRLSHEESFDLSLTQHGDSIVGYHCAVTRNAARVDCAMEFDAEGDSSDQPTIVGTVTGATAHVHFTSAYGINEAGGPIGGEATMSLRNGELHWAISHADEGEFYIPMQATLVRSHPAGKSTAGAH
ncbi:MAG TPA: hypothetical protein VHI13_03085 [Candidatus Kapabacteria bacterium]|nr:hypothetical protein [Candidatus Kapabacteria bacterium]